MSYRVKLNDLVVEEDRLKVVHKRTDTSLQLRTVRSAIAYLKAEIEKMPEYRTQVREGVNTVRQDLELQLLPIQDADRGLRS